MKAWEFEHKLTADAVPPELHDDNEADWMTYTEAGRSSDKPRKSEYYAVVKHALDLCKENSSWESVWAACEERYKEYNWIHAYPNAAAEVIALWFGNMDFKETCHIIAMEGQDADCTAAPVLNALALMIGLDVIDDSYVKPIGDRILTTMRRYQDFKITELCQWTTDAVRNAMKEQK